LLAEVVRQRLRGEKSRASLVRSLTASPVVSQVVSEPTFETEAIVAVIESLPRVHREALTAEVCFQRDGRPRPAEAMGVSEGTARVRLVRARLALLRALKGGPLDSEASDG
jgi:DNA-directed RNA polymerase specialized sigma24 family protein